MRYSKKTYSEFEKHLQSLGFNWWGNGSFRNVYERGSVVIKVPANRDGLYDNMAEARAYRKYKNGPTRRGILLTPCRLLPNGSLMMKKVNVRRRFFSPNWIEFIDGNQCGIYKGRVRAYDYALDLVDRFEWEKEWGIKSSFFQSSNWRCRRPHINSYLKRKEKASVRKAG